MVKEGSLCLKNNNIDKNIDNESPFNGYENINILLTLGAKKDLELLNNNANLLSF